MYVITGPQSWSGPVGQLIAKDVWKSPLVEFEPLPNPSLLDLIQSMKAEVLDKLNHDYIYLLEMGRGVMTGQLADRWRDMQAGACTTVRWTNPQSRALRLYMSTASPSFALQRLVHFIVYVYLPTLIIHQGEAEE